MDVNKTFDRAKNNPIEVSDVYKNIIEGFYPELYLNKELTSDMFYSNYVEIYIERVGNEIINVKDKFTFRRFIELLASLTEQELVYDNIANAIRVDIKTIKSWISVLLAGDIIYLLEPYNETSIKKELLKDLKLILLILG